MTRLFRSEIDTALGDFPPAGIDLHETGPARLPAWFAVADLAQATVRATGLELAALTGARALTVDQRLALKWFGMTLRPIGWDLPAAWDPIAGDYAARDGWIRLHTNAPRHRRAALAALNCAADRAVVAATVADWSVDDLETAVITAGGAAAAMRSLTDWASHPQGRALAAEPLIAWSMAGSGHPPVGLIGLRVLDLTRVLAGPVATRVLAGFGAEVLRLDPPDWDEPGVEPEVTLGKRCAGLDLRSSADRAVFEALLGRADVLVHGYRPGALAGLGYDTERLRRIAPALTEISLDAYGWTGPWAGRRGFDSLVQMSSGIAAEGMVRAGADRPVPLPVQALDHATGWLMAAAVLRALRRRNLTGQIWSARLSLARTALLLTAPGSREEKAEMSPETPADLADGIEATGWGPAGRLRFPLLLDKTGPEWRYPASPLRSDAPCWMD